MRLRAAVARLVHGVAWRAEYLLDRLRGQRDPRVVIEPYIGYADPDHLVLRGRVLTALRRHKPAPTQSLWLNFKQMLSLFLTDEVAGVELQARGVTAISDEEGYFTLLLPREARIGAGWREIPVSIPGRKGSAICPVLIASPEARFAVVSDIDDTLLRTGAYSLLRNLWTSLTGNALTRRIFPDAVTFIRSLSQDGLNPVYYVSSSPWNLHHFLTRIFARAGLLRGPKFLRDLGLSKTQFITGSHGDHKGSSINVLMAANPDLAFVLIGDTGQKDAFVYRDAVARHPGRVAAVVLREPGPGPDAASSQAMAEIAALGVTLLHGPSFEGFAAELLAEPVSRKAHQAM
ncbi:phosphatase domain-containing protein [Sulfitobacter aestuarii]|uniref:Phosphatase domain-containing protein n=1 Tax=Sulfitobacter aestuarii TaxID=2161676 RepID=A0ABW5U7D1_9RHOB